MNEIKIPIKWIEEIEKAFIAEYYKIKSSRKDIFEVINKTYPRSTLAYKDEKE